jgi:hypothetical protein
MQGFRFLHLTILSILVGCSALVFAQDDKQQEEKPAARQEEPKAQPKQEEPKAEPKPEASRPETKQDEMKAPRQEEAKPSKPEMRQEEQPKREQDSRDQAKPQPQEHPEQRAEHAQPAGKSARIPDDKFRSHFGRDHHFSARTVIVSGRPQFQYGGYNFQIVDAWPGDWAYTDDCYIDYIDGEYFLFDLLHPGVRIAVFVVM